MPKQDDDYSLSASEGMRFAWEPYTRAEIDALAKTLGNPEDEAARNVDPRIPRLIATVLRGFAEEPDVG